VDFTEKRQTNTGYVMCSPTLSQGKDDGKTGTNDGHKKYQESCQVLERNMEIRDHL
jgi:hypothetical protein